MHAESVRQSMAAVSSAADLINVSFVSAPSKDAPFVRAVKPNAEAAETNGTAAPLA